MNVQRPVAVPEVEGLEHAGQAQPVVGVQVRDEDLVEIGEADRAQKLALRSLAAVDQDAVASPADQERGQAAALTRPRTAGAREEER